MAMKRHKLIDPNDPIGSVALGIINILLLIALYGWAFGRDHDDQVIQCPRPGLGQQLIGRGHMETDGEPGELQCTYSTAPAHKRLVATNSDR